MILRVIALAFCILIPSAVGSAHNYDDSPLRIMPHEASVERTCLAMNLYFEAGNQSVAGKVAVANVTMNRVNHHKFPSTICGVIQQGPTYINWAGIRYPKRGMCQFSWYCDGRPDVPKDSITWMESLRIADAVLYMEYQDISDGALWYHADYVRPGWSNNLEKVMVVDNHIFYK
jgi:spore germination cell wall hydrolase CwlJ-like protein